jgi:tetratricopeptide (TPR) repeat protein
MKLLLKILLLFFLPSFTKAQTLRQIDSLQIILQHTANDTIRMGVCTALGGWYDDISVDSGLYYCNKGIALAEKLDLQLNKALTLSYMAWPLMKTGNYPDALKVINRGFKIAEDPSNEKKAGYLQNGQSLQMFRLYVIGLLYAARESLYFYVGDNEKLITATREAIVHSEASKDTFNLAGLYPDIGDYFLNLNQFDSALFYQQKSLEYYPKLSFDQRKFEGSTYTSIGNIYEKMGKTDLARENYLKAIQVSELHENFRHAGNA